MGTVPWNNGKNESLASLQGIENGQARLRAFPRSGFRPAVDGGLGETSWLFAARFTGLLAGGL